ncbi:hypothetical protein ACQKL5_06170 [Peribacillus sp. NPDC097675]|uniref:hypothetical protein n=1 Tax=Peribacillus sp. NPDC097675 TaxID=3390618 RepID=UPI003D00DB11
MVEKENRANKREHWKKQIKNNLRKESVKNIIARTADLAKLDANVNNTYTVHIKDGKMVKQPTNGKSVVINGKIQN